MKMIFFNNDTSMGQRNHFVVLPIVHPVFAVFVLPVELIKQQTHMAK